MMGHHLMLDMILQNQRGLYAAPSLLRRSKISARLSSSAACARQQNVEGINELNP